MANKTVVVFKIDDLVQQTNQQKSISQSDAKKCIENEQEDQLIDSKEITTIEDIAIIQSFWGVDQDRIFACNQALKKLLQMTVKPKDWIFVEAQKNKSDAAFGWVKHLGIKYLFKQIPKDSDGIFLKMPLWNIGVSNTSCERLCFIDSDVYFENNDWLNNVNEAFEKSYDIIQLHSYAKQEGKTDVIESIGHAIMEHKLETGEDLGFKFGHGGYTLGMTRNAYNMIDGFDAVNSLDDQWFWIKILGKKIGFDKYFILPYNPSNIYEDGYPVTIGSCSNVCIHLNHTMQNDYYALCNQISFNNIKYTYDISYSNVMPTWNNNIYGKMTKYLMEKLHNGLLTLDNIQQVMFDWFYKNILNNNKKTLIITTIWHPSYNDNSSSCVKALYDKLLQIYKHSFIFICFSNELIDGIFTIPYKRYEINQKRIKYNNILDIINNVNIKYPSKSHLIYIDVHEQNISISQFINNLLDK